MNPDIITTYDQFKNISNGRKESLFWIIEYSPAALGYNKSDNPHYLSSYERYSLMYNECLHCPQDFARRLDEGIYRIWITTPYEYIW